MQAQAGMEYVELNYGYFGILTKMVGTTVLAYVLALILYLTVELPITRFLRLMLDVYFLEEREKGIKTSENELTMQPSQIESHINIAYAKERLPCKDIDGKMETIMGETLNYTYFASLARGMNTSVMAYLHELKWYLTVKVFWRQKQKKM